MPDLGKYAFVVLASYGGTVALVGVLIAQSLWRAGRVRRALERAEARGREGRHG